MPHVTEQPAPCCVSTQLSRRRAPWFADLHVHSEDTVGINNTEYNLTYGRDVAGLDVLGYTANDFNITERNWNTAVDLIHSLHTDGEFVCFPEPNGAATPAPAAITTSSSCTATSPSSRSTAPASPRARSNGTRK